MQNTVPNINTNTIGLSKYHAFSPRLGFFICHSDSILSQLQESNRLILCIRNISGTPIIISARYYKTDEYTYSMLLTNDERRRLIRLCRDLKKIPEYSYSIPIGQKILQK